MRQLGWPGPALFKHIRTDKKNHRRGNLATRGGTAEHVAALIRKALEYIPKEQLVISTDCGFGREGLSRRIAFYKCVALVRAPTSSAANSACRKRACGRPTRSCGSGALTEWRSSPSKAGTVCRFAQRRVHDPMTCAFGPGWRSTR